MLELFKLLICLFFWRRGKNKLVELKFQVTRIWSGIGNAPAEIFPERLDKYPPFFDFFHIFSNMFRKYWKIIRKNKKNGYFSNFSAKISARAFHNQVGSVLSKYILMCSASEYSAFIVRILSECYLDIKRRGKGRQPHQRLYKELPTPTALSL